MSTLTIPRFNESGLGDRLCGMLLITVYARLHGHTHIQVPWPKYVVPHIKAPEHRKSDILLSNVNKYLVLPRGLNFIDQDTLPLHSPWWYREVGIGSRHFHSFHSECLTEFRLEETIEVARQVCRECGFNHKILEVIKNFGDYASIHIRRTDKV